MLARLAQLDVDIANLEWMILYENASIISALRKGADTASQERQVSLLNEALRVKNGIRRKLLDGLQLSGGPWFSVRAVEADLQAYF